MITNERHFLFFKSRSLHPTSNILKHLSKEISMSDVLIIAVWLSPWLCPLALVRSCPTQQWEQILCAMFLNHRAMMWKFWPRVYDVWEYFEILTRGIWCLEIFWNFDPWYLMFGNMNVFFNCLYLETTQRNSAWSSLPYWYWDPMFINWWRACYYQIIFAHLYNCHKE